MYEAASRSFNDRLWKVAHGSSMLDYVEQAFALGIGILIKKLMNSKQ